MPAEKAIILGVGAVIWNDRGEVLLIRRKNPPMQNQWSLPGGRVEFGETLRDGLAREVLEETGLAVAVLGLIDVVELVCDAAMRAEDRHYVLVDFCARVVAGNVVAGSDASEARWFTGAEIEALPLWSETRRIIAAGANLRDRMSRPPS